MELDEKQEEKYRHLTGDPVEGLVCRLAVPSMVSMLVTAFYNMADTFFVGMLRNNSATGAVGVVFSLMAVIQAVGFFFGHGSGNFISRTLGGHHPEEAGQMAATGFFAALATGGVIAVLGLLFLDPLARALGSTETILPYARDYMRFILIGAPYMTASLVLNNQLRFQGSAVYGMVGIASGAVLNIALDPIFIFTLDMGVAGAALATILSQLVSFCLLLVGCTRGGNLHIRISNVRLQKRFFREILRGGLPSLARQGLSSVAAICLNHAAQPYGDAAIAAMSVVSRIMNFASSSLIGFGQGFQPVCGFNYGAQLYGRVRRAFWFCVKVSTVCLVVIAVAGACFSPQLIEVFRDDPVVVEYGTTALRLQWLSFPTVGFVTMSNMMLQTIGRTRPATVLAMGRQGLFFLPFILVLPGFLGMLGVQLSQPLADLLTFVIAVPIQLHVLRQMARLPEAERL